MSTVDGLLSRDEPQSGGFWSYLKHRQLDTYPSTALRWWLVGVITIAWAAEQFERLRLSPVLVYFLDDFGINLTTYGYMHLAGAVATGIGSYALGGISDRFGRRPAIVWPMVIYVFLLAGMASSSSVWVYITFFTLGAFLVMGMSAAVNAAIRDLLPRVGRAFGYAFVSLAWTLGAFMTQGVAALTIPIWPGWRPQHWIGLAVAVVITAAIWLTYRDLSPRLRARVVEDTAAQRPQSHGRPATPDETERSGTAVFRHPHIWLLSSVLVWWGITYATLVALLPTYLTQWHGIAPSRAAALSTYFFLFAGICSFGSAILSDRTGLRKLVIAMGVIVVGMLIIAASLLPRDASYGTVLLMWLGVAAFTGFLYPSWCALLSENAEDISPFGVGRAFGLSGALGIVTGLVHSLVMPQVVERAGWNVWLVVIACCAMINVVWISFAKGPWLRRNA